MLQQLKKELRTCGTPERAAVSKGFFKTGPGQYGEGDVFVGVSVPDQRAIAKRYIDLPLDDIASLLRSKEHEFRMTALLIMTYRFPRMDDAWQKKFYDLYLTHTRWINNWDLVDVSAEYIVGAYLKNRDRKPLLDLARSESLWERRIAMLSTLAFIKAGDPKTTFDIANILLDDEHDLIRKAVGWMLREVGKRCGEHAERKFLDKHADRMPRTMLRYAIERLPDDVREEYMRRG